jgi:hypothetical protein
MPAATERAITRPYRLLFALFVLAPAARVTYTIDSIRDMRHQYPAQPVALGIPWPSIISVGANAHAAGGNHHTDHAGGGRFRGGRAAA